MNSYPQGKPGDRHAYAMTTSHPNPIPFLDLKAQYATIRHEVRAAIDRVVEAQQFMLGPEVEALEREVAEYSQCAHAIGVSSGTDALLASLMAIETQPGDEVITTPYSFFATAGSIDRVRARPVFVDIDPLTYNIDPQAIEAAITERTRAIIPVHLFGQVAEMDPIMEIAHRHKLYVIEDAAQAIGAEHRGRRAGSIGHLGCFSYFPSKNLGGFGDGGMVTTNDPALADSVRLLRNHGAGTKYFHRKVGGNFRLDAIQAAVLRVKLRHLDRWTEAHQQRAASYRRLFADAELASPPEPFLNPDGASALKADTFPRRQGVVLPTEASDRRHVYNQFVVRTLGQDRLVSYLEERQIGCAIYYPLPLHLQECFLGLGYRTGDLPASELSAKQAVALPIYPELTDEMLATVVGAIEEFQATAG